VREQAKIASAAALILVAAFSVAAITFYGHTTPSSTTLYVDPPFIEDPVLAPNDTVVMWIKIDSVVGMKNCEYNLTYNPDVLSLQRVTKGQVQGLYPKMSLIIDDIAGYVWTNLTYANPLTIVSNTTLVEMEFFIRDYGASPLHFDSSALRDGSGNSISHDTQDGFVLIFRRNIAVIDISSLYSETYVGRTIPVNVTVLNEGDIPETFNVTLYYETTLIGEQQVANLPPKENTTLTFNWNTSPVPASLVPYTLTANATILPYETNTTDNKLVDGTVTLKIVGDVNGDGEVNITDLVEWDAAYLSHPNDPNWNAQADLDYSGLVDGDDAKIIIDHYKETL